MRGTRNTIKSFSEIDNSLYREQVKDNVVKEIHNADKQYILGVDENEYINYLISKYSLTPLSIDFDNEVVPEPVVSKEWLESRGRGERYQTDVYTFTITYRFTGSADVFRIRPDTFIMRSSDIYVNSISSTVSYSFKIYKLEPDEFKRVKDDSFRGAFANLNNANEFVQKFNTSIKNILSSSFQAERQKYLRENDFFEAINVKVNKDTSSVFSAPTISKKIIPKPVLEDKKEFSSEPMMSGEMYNDILKVIYESGKNMEKKPALYYNKDEEGLRDQFLFVLETRYDGTTATGETFNRRGKTDIILKYAEDASNLFVAECKFWYGRSEFLKAISQLFDRYLTWRDSKTALIIFVKNKDFTTVINTVKEAVIEHPYYVKSVGQRGETSLSYIFRLPQDKNKHVFFELTLFHYDK